MVNYSLVVFSEEIVLAQIILGRREEEKKRREKKIVSLCANTFYSHCVLIKFSQLET